MSRISQPLRTVGLDRRRFLFGGAMLSAGALVAGCTSNEAGDATGGSSANVGAAGGDNAEAGTADDAALFLARFAGGAVATFEASRVTTGRRTRCASS